MKHFIKGFTCYAVLFGWLLIAGQASANPKGSSSEGGSNSGAESNAFSGSESFSLATSISNNNANADLVDSSVNTYDSWALSIPGSTSAPAVALKCIEHTAGWSVGPLFSKSGKTQYNEQCVTFSQCVTIVRLYAELNDMDTALAVLETCAAGGEDELSDSVRSERATERRSDTQERSRRATRSH